MYLHVPFCKSRCTYCDFVSFTDFSWVEEYFQALWKEIELWSKFLPKVRVGTIYIGGGSPSDVPFELLQITLQRIRDMFLIADDFEFTIELNPNCEFVERLESLSVNRVSIGLQAADNEVLKRVKRRHSVDDFFRTYEIAKSFAKVNVDFIVGLPGESDRTIENDVRIVEMLKPDHVSIYLLETHEIELNTPVNHVVENHYECFVEAVKAMGYHRYEISNFALNGSFCRHNLKYWRNQDYVGLGVAAGGHLGRIRYVNSSRIDEYIRKLKNEGFAFDHISKNDDLQELKETIFMGLRLSEGVSVERLRRLWRTFEPEELFSDLLGEFLEIKDESLRMTERGFDLSARVLADVIDRISLMAVGR
ncbi:radical SAM family heme chaperone HemW [Pseudothermotoga sp.]